MADQGGHKLQSPSVSETFPVKLPINRPDNPPGRLDSPKKIIIVSQKVMIV